MDCEDCRHSKVVGLHDTGSWIYQVLKSGALMNSFLIEARKSPVTIPAVVFVFSLFVKLLFKLIRTFCGGKGIKETVLFAAGFCTAPFQHTT